MPRSISATPSSPAWTRPAAAGVSVDLARAYAGELGVELELVVVDAAGKSVDIVTQAQADIGFSPSIPCGAGIAFTEPYVLIEGSYLVRQDSPLRANEVDRAGLRVAVGKGSAYDLYLTRELKAAEIVRAPTSPAVVDTFLEQSWTWPPACASSSTRPAMPGCACCRAASW